MFLSRIINQLKLHQPTSPKTKLKIHQNPEILHTRYPKIHKYLSKRILLPITRSPNSIIHPSYQKRKNQPKPSPQPTSPNPNNKTKAHQTREILRVCRNLSPMPLKKVSKPRKERPRRLSSPLLSGGARWPARLGHTVLRTRPRHRGGLLFPTSLLFSSEKQREARVALAT